MHIVNIYTPEKDFLVEIFVVEDGPSGYKVKSATAVIFELTSASKSPSLITSCLYDFGPVTYSLRTPVLHLEIWTNLYTYNVFIGT